MRGIQDFLNRLDGLTDELQSLLQIQKSQQKADEHSWSNLDGRDVRRRWEKYESLIREVHQQRRELAERFMLFPPRCEARRSELEQFWIEGTYERSVFVMTKFPEDIQPRDVALERVIDAVSAGLESRGYVARLASAGSYAELLWENVEVYMIGCHRGIAIVEDRYRPELNPNVAIEWGWMRGMGRQVHFLKERTFANLRADFVGRLSAAFDWEDPAPGVEAALEHWFPLQANGSKV